MHEPFRLSLEEWVPQCRLIYDKFHIMQHANEAVSQIKRAEFFHRVIGTAHKISHTSDESLSEERIVPITMEGCWF